MKKYLMACVSGLVMLASCKEEQGGPAGQAFDRGSMLAYYVDNHIQPAFDQLADAAQELHSRLPGLAAQPQQAQLVELRQSWSELYAAWMLASNYSIGPGGEQGLRKRLAEELGTFPVSEAKINQFALAGDTSFANFDRDSRGLFAIEYLLFAGNDNDVLQRLAQPAYRNYLLALTGQVNRESRRVATEWQTYRASFVSSTGTTAGSSTVILYNEFLIAYENLKNFKLGIPLGLRMGQTQAEPAKVEALYSGLSLNGIRLQMAEIERFWRGANNTGFRAYLLSAVGGAELVERTEQQLAVINGRLQAMGNGRLDEMIVNQPQPAIDLHTELQRNTRFFKSDFSSLLGLTITFSSGDGD